MIEFHLSTDPKGGAALGESTYIGAIENGEIIDTAEDLPDLEYGSVRSIDHYVERLEPNLFDSLVDPIAVIQEAPTIPNLIAAVPARENAECDTPRFLDGDWEQIKDYGDLSEQEWAEFNQWDLTPRDEPVFSPTVNEITKDYDYPDRFRIVAIIVRQNSQSKASLAGSWDTNSQEIVADPSGSMEKHLAEIREDPAYDLTNALGLVKHGRRPYIFYVVDTETQGYLADGDVLQGHKSVPNPEKQYPELLP